jgi:hypothetical protein
LAFIIRKKSPDSLFYGDKIEDNVIDLSGITLSGNGGIIVMFCYVNLEGRRIFEACVLIEVECDLETAGSRQGFSSGIIYVRYSISY